VPEKGKLTDYQENTMLKIVSSVCAAAMMLTLPLTTPGFALPKAAPAPVAQTNIIQAQVDIDGKFVRERDWRRGDRDWRRGDRDYRRGGDRWRGPDRSPGFRDDMVRRGDYYYYRGHRGYRHHRPGYRQYNGWWFPPAAFIAGAIIGGAIANEPPVQYRPRGNAHVDWCYNRYRSYRASDNSYQPYNGPRRQCVSPYG
jgi:hypothetical protein